MTKATRALVELTFGDGEVIRDWLEYTFRQNYLDALGSFSLTTAPTPALRNDRRERLKKGEIVTLSINGAPQATVVIETAEQVIDEHGYAIAVECKSTLASSTAPGTVDPYIAKEFTADTPIADVVLEVMRPFGFSVIRTDASANVTAISGKSLTGRKDPPVLSTLKHRDVKSDSGQSAYGFVSPLFMRLGLSLRVNAKGELLLGSPDYDQSTAYVVVESLGQGISGDRMLREPAIVIRDTNEGQYSEQIVTGKLPDNRGTRTATQAIAGVRVPGITRPTGAPFDYVTFDTRKPGRHLYSGPWRPNFRIDKRSRDQDRCNEMAHLIHGARSSQAFTVKHSVDGLISSSGRRVWAVDTVGRVIVAHAEIDESMWLMEIVQTMNRRKAQETSLTWIPLGALVLGGGG